TYSYSPTTLNGYTTEIVPSQITYGPASSPRTVKFNYMTPFLSPPLSVGFRGGMLKQQTNLIRSIDMKVGNQVMRSYKMSWGASHTTNRRQLAGIYDCESDATNAA